MKALMILQNFGKYLPVEKKTYHPRRLELSKLFPLHTRKHKASAFVPTQLRDTKLETYYNNLLTV
jgi:hypothetical protein